MLLNPFNQIDLKQNHSQVSNAIRQPPTGTMYFLLKEFALAYLILFFHYAAGIVNNIEISSTNRIGGNVPATSLTSSSYEFASVEQFNASNQATPFVNGIRVQHKGMLGKPEGKTRFRFSTIQCTSIAFFCHTVCNPKNIASIDQVDGSVHDNLLFERRKTTQFSNAIRQPLTGTMYFLLKGFALGYLILILFFHYAARTQDNIEISLMNQIYGNVPTTSSNSYEFASVENFDAKNQTIPFVNGIRTQPKSIQGKPDGKSRFHYHTVQYVYIKSYKLLSFVLQLVLRTRSHPSIEVISKMYH